MTAHQQNHHQIHPRCKTQMVLKDKRDKKLISSFREENQTHVVVEEDKLDFFLFKIDPKQYIRPIF
jgi:hypothetical protein